MKIAHIGEIAGVSSLLSSEQHQKGNMVDVFVFDNLTQHRFGGIHINYNSFIEKTMFYVRLKLYDVWHYHYPYGTLYNYLKKNYKKKIFLKHYHGSDLRDSGRKDFDFCLVSTPDLLKYAPKGTWLPNPINLTKIDKFQKPSNENASSPIRIAHYPYYNNRPEWDHFTSVFNRLEKTNKAKIIKIFNLTYEQSLESISNCDIVVGKILPEIGWIGKFELEGMALGKPVMAYISDELYEQYKPPVYRTTKETFKKDLLSFIDDKSEQKRLSREGPKYVKKYHDSKTISNKIFEYYDRLKNNDLV